MTTLAIFTLSHDLARKRAQAAIATAPHGARVKIEDMKTHAPAAPMDKAA